ncbi:MAG: aspartate-semialdehyde dehydrogenase [Candidatus Thorarchaeota archaeon]
MSKLRACVMGATGIVGQHFVRALDDHPYFELNVVTASKRSDGLGYKDATDWIVSERIPDSAQELQVSKTDAKIIVSNEVDLVFSALPSGVAYDIEAEIASRGLPVFSNAGAHRMNPLVPILIPEVNPEHLKLVELQDYDGGYIVTNSNCSVSGLVLGLKPLMPFVIKTVTVSTYQALSGAGRKGVASMDIQGNVIPFIANEEDKMRIEGQKILGTVQDRQVKPADFKVYASCARVSVMDGHLESVVVEFDAPVDVHEASQVLSEFTGPPQEMNLPSAPEKPIILLEERDRPQPRRDISITELGKGMDVKIGRLRSEDNRLSFFLLVHNTIRGAAGASVLNAEYAYAKGFLKKLEELT